MKFFNKQDFDWHSRIMLMENIERQNGFIPPALIVEQKPITVSNIYLIKTIFKNQSVEPAIGWAGTDGRVTFMMNRYKPY